MNLELLRHTLFLAVLSVANPLLGARCEASDPLWAIDLAPYGFVADEQSWAQANNPEGMIAFSNEKELVILNQTFEKPYQSTVRAFLLDARSGSLLSQSAWTRQTQSGLFAVRGGRYAVLSEHGTTLYDRGFERTSVTTKHSVELVSPNGGRLAARTRRNEQEVWITLDPNSLAENGMIPGAQKPSIAENAVADIRLRARDNPQLEISDAKGIYRRELSGGASSPRFVSEGLIVLVVDGRFTVVDLRGNQMFMGALKYDWNQFVSCRDGSRMAVVEQRWSEIKGKASKESVRVFDLRTGGEIWSIQNRVLDASSSSARSGVALSPSCSVIAIRSMGLVRVFGLPETDAVSEHGQPEPERPM